MKLKTTELLFNDSLFSVHFLLFAFQAFFCILLFLYEQHTQMPWKFIERNLHSKTVEWKKCFCAHYLTFDAIVFFLFLPIDMKLARCANQISCGNCHLLWTIGFELRYSIIFHLINGFVHHIHEIIENQTLWTPTFIVKTLKP